MRENRKEILSGATGVHGKTHRSRWTLVQRAIHSARRTLLAPLTNGAMGPIVGLCSSTGGQVAAQNFTQPAAWFTVVALALALAAGQAQTFTTLKSFGILSNVTGFNPQSTLVQGTDGTLYGTTKLGEGPVAGTVFKVQPDGSGFTVLKMFTNSIEGANPYAGLTLSGSVLYGTTALGGSLNYGTVFKVNTDGTGYTVLKNFTGSDGANPVYAALVVSGSLLYGTTYYGGSSNSGTLFKVNTDGTGYLVLRSFAGGTNDGANPNVALTLSGNMIYGTTENGGSFNSGMVFKIGANGTGYTMLHNFTNNPDGAFPDGVLTLSGGVLYGTTYRGGISGWAGTLFKVNTNGTGYAVLKNFDGGSGDANPSGALPLSGGALYGTASSGNGAVFRLNTNGTGYTVLRAFTNSPDGATPYAGVMLSGSVLYGTTYSGGSSTRGTVFKMNTNGTGYAVLQLFNPSDGAIPYAGLTLSGGALYGTTYSGGTSNCGTVFKVNQDGTGYSVLKIFTGGDGAGPWAVLTVAGTVLYGTTTGGGSSGNGTVFAVSSDGSGFTNLYSFTATSTDASGAYTNSDGSFAASLILSGNTIYGTAYSGGASGNGTVFRLNSDGTGFTNLHNFTALSNFYSGTNRDGAFPWAGVILSGNTLYGTAVQGGSSGNGTVFALNTDGTGFTNLYSFTAGPGDYPSITNSDGAYPYGGLLLSGNTLYGTAATGGHAGNGTVFALNTGGTAFTSLHNFTAGVGSFPSITNGDGTYPGFTLVLSNNTLYGIALYGGSSGNGTLFAVHTDGTGFTNLYDFTGGSDGAYPVGSLLSGDALYGTAYSGGFLGNGTVFRLSYPPQLAITPAGINVIVSWPANVAGFDYTGYTLQSTANLVSPAVWVTNSPAPVVVSGQNTVTNPAAGTRRFYRLIH
jgi:uncharacterized repeat protein (TIGR03803 family)